MWGQQAIIIHGLDTIDRSHPQQTNGLHVWNNLLADLSHLGLRLVNKHIVEVLDGEALPLLQSSLHPEHGLEVVINGRPCVDCLHALPQVFSHLGLHEIHDQKFTTFAYFFFLALIGILSLGLLRILRTFLRFSLFIGGHYLREIYVKVAFAILLLCKVFTIWIGGSLFDGLMSGSVLSWATVWVDHYFLSTLSIRLGLQTCWLRFLLAATGLFRSRLLSLALVSLLHHHFKIVS